MEKPTIKQIRISKGLKPSQLAKLAGTSVFTIYRIEKGNPHVAPETVVRVCLALGITLDSVKEGEIYGTF